MLDKCWLCLRITPQDVAKAVHSIPIPEKVKHEMLTEAVASVEKAYYEKPPFFCGKSKIRIIGGLLYILSFKYGQRVTQKEVATSLSYLRPRSAPPVELNIRNGYRDWLQLSIFDPWLKDLMNIGCLDFWSSDDETCLRCGEKWKSDDEDPRYCAYCGAHFSSRGELKNNVKNYYAFFQSRRTEE